MTAPLSSIIFLSDCTPLYTILGAPGRITNVSGVPLYRSIRLIWSPPENSNEVLIDSYIVRYGKYGAPQNNINGYINVFLPTVVIPELDNGVLYSFWVSAKNRFGESPLSPTVSLSAGSAPSSIPIVRRAYHTTTNGSGSGSTQKIGIEFTSPTNYNGNIPTTFTIKYRLLDGNTNNYDPRDISFTQVESVQANEQIKDASNNMTLTSNGVKGNFIRKEIIPNYVSSAFKTGRYQFTVYTTNNYGLSNVSDVSFIVYLYSATDSVGISRFISPSFSFRPPISPDLSSGLPNGNIISLAPLDKSFRFKWKQYVDTLNSPTPSYTGWMYRIQYTDNKDYWYYPSYNSSSSTYYPEYTVPYNTAGDPDTIYTLDISKNLINGRKYYVRYCVVNALGDTSEYTQVTDTNQVTTSVIPGKLPESPTKFYAGIDDRMIRLYFNWDTRPPSIELTGGYPILDYQIKRYRTLIINGVVTNELEIIFENLIGPYYEDTYNMVTNGSIYFYEIRTRTAIGYSAIPNTVSAVPSCQSNVVTNVTSEIGSKRITLSWVEPSEPDPLTPINQYYIEYKLYDIYDVSNIPTGNIVGSLSNPLVIENNISDMNSILVNDALWSTLTVKATKIFTNSLNLSYTITDLIDNKAYIFRVAAVTLDRLRRKSIGLLSPIDSDSPYLPHPTIIGKVPNKLTNVSFTNGSNSVNIEWSSNDIDNITERISHFIVDYREIGSSVYSRQTFDYLNSIKSKDTTTTYFSITIVNLTNNVATRPLSNTDSYDIIIYAENPIGYTNDSDRIHLGYLTQTINNEAVRFSDIYENASLTRFVRPRTLPNIVIEQR